jgi:hypothetical protein
VRTVRPTIPLRLVHAPRPARSRSRRRWWPSTNQASRRARTSGADPITSASTATTAAPTTRSPARRRGGGSSRSTASARRTAAAGMPTSAAASTSTCSLMPPKCSRSPCSSSVRSLARRSTRPTVSRSSSCSVTADSLSTRNRCPRRDGLYSKVLVWASPRPRPATYSRSARPAEQTATQRRPSPDTGRLDHRDSFRFGLDVKLAGLDQLRPPPTRSTEPTGSHTRMIHAPNASHVAATRSAAERSSLQGCAILGPGRSTTGPYRPPRNPPGRDPCATRYRPYSCAR